MVLPLFLNYKLGLSVASLLSFEQRINSISNSCLCLCLIVSRVIPTKNDCIAARVVKPQTMSVGIFSTVPTFRKVLNTGMKKGAELSDAVLSQT